MGVGVGKNEYFPLLFYFLLLNTEHGVGGLLWAQIKLASVKLAMKYMKRVSAELETVAGGPEEVELIVQGVRFAFRVHQVTFLFGPSFFLVLFPPSNCILDTTLGLCTITRLLLCTWWTFHLLKPFCL